MGCGGRVGGRSRLPLTPGHPQLGQATAKQSAIKRTGLLTQWRVAREVGCAATTCCWWIHTSHPTS
jgi:hypothetical protein